MTERAKRFVILLNRGLDNRVEVLPPVRDMDSSASTSDQGYSFYFHKKNQRAQDEFRQMITDERTHEGQKIKQWRDFVAAEKAKKNGKILSPTSILKFIDFLANEIIERHRLRQYQISDQGMLNVCCHLYCQRVLFPLLNEEVACFQTDQERKMDREFHRKIRWVRSLTQEQIGIDPKLQFLCHHCANLSGNSTADVHNRVAYGAAVDVLSKLDNDNNEMVCSDMVYVILKAIQTLFKQATFYAKANMRCTHRSQLPSLDSLELSPACHQSTQNSTSPSTSSNCESNSTSTTSTTSITCSDPISATATSSETELSHPSATSDSPDNLSTSASTTTASSFTNSARKVPLTIEPTETALDPSTDLPSPKPPHLSADMLFPIVVWVVLHARVSHIHTSLGFLDRFLPHEQKHFGELGMSLTLIKAAASHINDLDPATYDVDLTPFSPASPASPASPPDSTQ